MLKTTCGFNPIKEKSKTHNDNKDNNKTIDDSNSLLIKLEIKDQNTQQNNYM